MSNDKIDLSQIETAELLAEIDKRHEENQRSSKIKRRIDDLTVNLMIPIDQYIEEIDDFSVESRQRYIDEFTAVCTDMITSVLKESGRLNRADISRGFVKKDKRD